MKDNLLDTPEKIESAISSFNNLLGQPGWILLQQMVDANIEILTKQILEGNGSKEEIDRLRFKLQAYKDVISTPMSQIKFLKKEEAPSPSFDPYDKPKVVEEPEEEEKA